MERFERELLEGAIAKSAGDVRAAARNLGLPVHVLELKMERFAINPRPRALPAGDW